MLALHEGGTSVDTNSKSSHCELFRRKGQMIAAHRAAAIGPSVLGGKFVAAPWPPRPPVCAIPADLPRAKTRATELSMDLRRVTRMCVGMHTHLHSGGDNPLKCAYARLRMHLVFADSKAKRRTVHDALDAALASTDIIVPDLLPVSSRAQLSAAYRDAILPTFGPGAENTGPGQRGSAVQCSGRHSGGGRGQVRRQNTQRSCALSSPSGAKNSCSSASTSWRSYKFFHE
jgi:hypothetical protein